VLDDNLLEEKNISTLKKLLNQHQLHYLRKVNSCSKNVASMRKHLGKKVIRVESTHFFDEDRSYGLFEIFFQQKDVCVNANDNVVSYHEVPVIWKIKEDWKTWHSLSSQNLSLDIETFVES
jgi:hypothetical protein